MKKILIVDDQSFIRTVLKNQIEKEGEVEIVEAANGNEAVGKAKVVRPNLILMDIVMPNKDGLAAIEELKNHDSTKMIPVIIVSSHADQEKQDQAKALGVVEFVDKAQLSNIDFMALVKKHLI